MEQNPILPVYYRMRLSDALAGRLESSAGRRIRAAKPEGLLVTDIVTVRNLSGSPAPIADPGELKHAPLDKKDLRAPTESSINVRQAESASNVAAASSAHRYRIYSSIDSTEFRRKAEERVRRCKRAGSECPYKDENGQCSMLFIRCGDRLQFSMRESGSERRHFHTCTYDWRKRGERVLIVDDNQSMLDFCKSAFTLFLSYDEDKIATAGSVDMAIELLSRSKVEGSKFGLIISDIVMPGRTGYDLVNECYNRNFEIEIMLMRDEHESPPEPPGYKGAVEVLPNQPFAGGTLVKPFHSEKLIAEVMKLKFWWGRE